MSINVTWYGHSCFLVSDNEASVLIDPFITGNPMCPISVSNIPKVDVVLVTHDHGDHTGDAVEICNKQHVLCACVVGTAATLVERGIKQELVPAGIGFNIGGTIERRGVHITMTQAFHTSDTGLPVGYVVTMPSGFTFYHAGDTGIFGDMALIGSLYKPQLAMLPCGGFFTMDGRQAAEAARLIGAPTVIPMHWGTFPVLDADPSAMAMHLAKVAPQCTMLRLEPGDAVTVD